MELQVGLGRVIEWLEGLVDRIVVADDRAHVCGYWADECSPGEFQVGKGKRRQQAWAGTGECATLASG